MKNKFYKLYRWIYYLFGRHVADERDWLNKIPKLSNIEDFSKLGKFERFQLGKACDIPIDVDSLLCFNGIYLPESSGGVNKGDRLALAKLISYQKPMAILEIGTCIGSSLASIVLGSSNGVKICSVDIMDVNLDDSYWNQRGCSHRPREIVGILNNKIDVEFVQSDSLIFLKSCIEKFDFIFLDGLHSSDRVYLEISYALNCLNQGGYILLHDFFPKSKKYWDTPAIPGPYLAVQRLIQEGACVEFLPFQELPWETKNGTKFSSLCLLTGK